MKSNKKYLFIFVLALFLFLLPSISAQSSRSSSGTCMSLGNSFIKNKVTDVDLNQMNTNSLLTRYSTSDFYVMGGQGVPEDWLSNPNFISSFLSTRHIIEQINNEIIILDSAIYKYKLRILSYDKPLHVTTDQECQDHLIVQSLYQSKSILLYQKSVLEIKSDLTWGLAEPISQEKAEMDWIVSKCNNNDIQKRIASNSVLIDLRFPLRLHAQGSKDSFSKINLAIQLDPNNEEAKNDLKRFQITYLGYMNKRINEDINNLRTYYNKHINDLSYFDQINPVLSYLHIQESANSEDKFYEILMRLNAWHELNFQLIDGLKNGKDLNQFCSQIVSASNDWDTKDVFKLRPELVSEDVANTLLPAYYESGYGNNLRTTSALFLQSFNSNPDWMKDTIAIPGKKQNDEIYNKMLLDYVSSSNRKILSYAVANKDLIHLCKLSLNIPTQETESFRFFGNSYIHNELPEGYSKISLLAADFANPLTIVLPALGGKIVGTIAPGICRYAGGGVKTLATLEMGGGLAIASNYVPDPYKSSLIALSNLVNFPGEGKAIRSTADNFLSHETSNVELAVSKSLAVNDIQCIENAIFIRPKISTINTPCTHCVLRCSDGYQSFCGGILQTDINEIASRFPLIKESSGELINIVRKETSKEIITSGATKITSSNINSIFAHQFDGTQFGAKAVAYIDEFGKPQVIFWKTGEGRLGIEVHHRDAFANLLEKEGGRLEAILDSNEQAFIREGLYDEYLEKATRALDYSEQIGSVRNQLSYPDDALTRAEGFQFTLGSDGKIKYFDIDSSITSTQISHGIPLDAASLSEMISAIHNSISPELRGYRSIRIKGLGKLQIKGQLTPPDGISIIELVE